MKTTLCILSSKAGMLLNHDWLSFTLSCVGRARRLNVQWWTRPGWLYQSGGRQEKLILSHKVYSAVTTWTNDNIHGLDNTCLSHSRSDPLFCASHSLSAAAVKSHAPIKCLPFQLFSPHVIPLLDYNPLHPPLRASPSAPLHTGSSVSIHAVQVQLHLMFSVICHMQLLG